jgi:hypothetical protein
MALLAAKWGRLWRALLGQAKIRVRSLRLAHQLTRHRPSPTTSISRGGTGPVALAVR